MWAAFMIRSGQNRRPGLLHDLHSLTGEIVVQFHDESYPPRAARTPPDLVETVFLLKRPPPLDKMLIR